MRPEAEYLRHLNNADPDHKAPMAPTETRTGLPYLGFGLRLRTEYMPQVLSERPDVDWFEIISENHLEAQGGQLDRLLAVRASYPLVMHGISLGIGSPWPLDRGYLGKLKRLIELVEPAWISDHLCWRGADEMHGSLLPLPYSPEMLDHVVTRIQRVQEMLGQRILLENVPAEGLDRAQGIPEAEFITEVARRSDSLVLIDVSNLLSSIRTSAIDADEYLSALSPAHIQQIHLGGAVALCGPGAEQAVAEEDPVWSLYVRILEMFGPVSTMIEREDTIAPLEEMVQEVSKARCSASTVLSRR